MSAMRDIGTWFQGKSVLITGGLGFIGSALTHRLAGCGARVTVMDSLDPRGGGNRFHISALEPGTRVVLKDLRDSASTESLVSDQDVVFNLAARESHEDSMRDPAGDLEANGSAQLALLEACRRRNPGVRLIFTSTRQVYGRPLSIPVSESHPLNPVDINGIHKCCAEAYHTLYGRVHGLRFSILRLTNTYGPRMFLRDAHLSFLGWFIRLAMEGREIPVYGDGRQVRDLTYVDDAIDALMLAAVSDRATGQVYNVGGSEALSLLALVEVLCRVAGTTSKCQLVPFPRERQDIDIGSYAADCRKITDVLGWRPTVSLDEGLRRTLEYAKTHWEHYV